MGCRDSIHHPFEYCGEVDEVSDPPLYIARDSVYFGVESNTGAICEKAIVHAARVNWTCGCVALQPAGKLRCRILPVNGYGTRFGEVISRSNRNNAEFYGPTGPEYAVDHFVNAAVSPSDQDFFCTGRYGIENPGFKITDRFTFYEYVNQADGIEQAGNSRNCSASPSPAGNRIEKKWNGLGVH